MSAVQYVNNVVLNNSTNTAFQAWGSAIANAFNTAGWVGVTGVGEVDWTTAAANASTLSSWGFEIWRMNDALQSTVPVYLRIDYGSGTTVTAPSIWLQLGSGSSGNTVTGAYSTQLRAMATGNSGTTAWPAYFCGANSRMVMVLAPASANAITFSIERTKDANGNDTEEGVLFFASNTSATCVQQYWNGRTGPAPSESGFGSFLPSTGLSATTGNTTMFFPNYFYRGVYTNPAMNMLQCVSGSVTPYSEVSFAYYGGTHTYIPLPMGVSNRTGYTATSTALLMRWE